MYMSLVPPPSLPSAPSSKGLPQRAEKNDIETERGVCVGERESKGEKNIHDFFFKQCVCIDDFMRDYHYIYT